MLEEVDLSEQEERTARPPPASPRVPPAGSPGHRRGDLSGPGGSRPLSLPSTPPRGAGTLQNTSVWEPWLKGAEISISTPAKWHSPNVKVKAPAPGGRGSGARPPPAAGWGLVLSAAGSAQAARCLASGPMSPLPGRKPRVGRHPCLALSPSADFTGRCGSRAPKAPAREAGPPWAGPGVLTPQRR